MNETTIPNQEEGGQSNTGASREFETAAAATEFFGQLKERLFHVNAWHDYSGQGTASFELYDAEGHPRNRALKEGDYFKIDIPAPGNQGGEGFDWVRVESVSEEQPNESSEQVMVTVRPCSSPLTNDNETAHFFTDAATSSFVIAREGNKLKASVHGRNEVPNTEAENILDKARNALVATAAIGLFSKMQWGRLVEGWLDKE